MATAQTTVEVKPSKELTEALDDVKAAIDSRLSLDYDTIHPIAMQSAQLVAEYYYALIERKVPSTLIDNLVYDFHRILWGQSLDS